MAATVIHIKTVVFHGEIIGLYAAWIRELGDYGARATMKLVTVLTPAFFNVLAISFKVAPLLITSSTTKTDKPFSLSDA